jgi:hypothetical protein
MGMNGEAASAWDADREASVTRLLEVTLDRLIARGAAAPESEREPEPGPSTQAGGVPAGAATIGALMEELDERGFGLLLLLFALPCCVPFLWGIPQVVALPMLALAFQLARGREAPWLPRALRDRPFDARGLRGVVRRLHRYIGWADRLAHPRLTFVTEGTGLKVVGLLLLIPTASILVPLPSTNTAPGIGVAIASMGLLERDGLLVIGGLAIGLAWVILLVVLTAVLGTEALSIVKAWILGPA